MNHSADEHRVYSWPLRFEPQHRTSRWLIAALVVVSLMWAASSHAATPQDAVANFVMPAVDATHSAAAACTIDRAGTSLGAVQPGSLVSPAAPDFGGPYTFNLTCTNSAGSSKATLVVSIPAVVLPPNPPTNFTLVFKCATASPTPTCVQQ